MASSSVNKSSKRKLYRPAASASSALRDRHGKSLVQGILADSSTSWQEELNSSISEVESQVEQVTLSRQRREIKANTYNEDSRNKTPERLSAISDDLQSPANKFRDGLRTPDKHGLRTPDKHGLRTPDKQTSISRYRNEVVVVDASGPQIGPESSEVSTTSHKIFSPVKVVCHSPSPDKENRQLKSDNIGEIYDVKVDSPAKLIFENKSQSQYDTNEDLDQDSTEKSSKTDPKLQDKPAKKKKKAPRVVQSRYKNPKESKPQKTSEDVQKVGKPAAHSFIHDISAIAPHSTVEGQAKGHGTKSKKAKVTSTPFNPAAWSEKTRMIADGSYLDISRHLTIGQHDVLHEIAKKDEKHGKAKHSSTGQGKTAITDYGIVSGIQEQLGPVTEKQAEMEYCRTLQAMFLSAKAKDAFSKQEKEAKDQIYNVWQENQKLKSEIRQLEQAVYGKKQAMTLDQLLKVQDEGLRSLDESLDRLLNNYSTMGEALDNTRHYLPVENIVITDEEKLIATLKESQMLQADISSYTGAKKINVAKVATNLSQIVDKFSSELSSLDRCQELLIAANTLTNHERSLQSQMLQSPENVYW